MTFGAESDGGVKSDGTFDEIRIMDIELDVDWIDFEYCNQSVTSICEPLTLGSETTNPPPVVPPVPVSGGAGGAGKGGIPTQPVFSDLLGLVLLGIDHKLFAGESIEGEITVIWDGEDDIKVTDIIVEPELIGWFDFPFFPIQLEYDSKATEQLSKIPYRITAPECTVQGCAEINNTKLVVKLEDSKGNKFTYELEMKIDLTTNIEPTIFMVLIALTAGVGAIVYGYRGKKKGGEKKTSGKKNSFMKGLNDLR